MLVRQPSSENGNGSCTERQPGGSHIHAEKWTVMPPAHGSICTRWQPRLSAVATSLTRSRHSRRIDGPRPLAREAPLACAWRSHRAQTNRAIQRRPSCTGSCGTISRPSVRTPRRCGTARGSQGLTSKSSATSCGADVWPADSLDFGAPPVDWIVSWLSRVRAADSARGVAADAWPSGRRISSIMSSPTCRSDSGSSASRIGCGTCWRGITSCVGP